MNRIAYRQAASFNDILSVVSSGVAKYRRTIFKTILLFLIIGKRRKRISFCFRMPSRFSLKPTASLSSVSIVFLTLKNTPGIVSGKKYLN